MLILGTSFFNSTLKGHCNEEMNNYQSAVEQLIRLAGIQINGNNACDICVHDDRFYQVVLRGGSLGLGEAYMEGWWDCNALDELLYKLMNAGLEKHLKDNLPLLFLTLKARLFNRQSRFRAADVAKIHYNLGNSLFENMLDKHMIYSCAYWEKAKTLDEAQEHKLDLICRKLHLSPGMTLLDIGCGWGGFARYAAEKYHVRITGITISPAQAELARNQCAGLSVDIRLQDYRDLKETFDRIVSIGMFEHVGYKNYRPFMNTVYSNLHTNGIFLLHCIGGNENVVATDPWINRYIFPNGMMPSALQIVKSIQRRFILQDWHNFGADYDRTLMEWLKRFKRSWPELKGQYHEEFYRMWEYYLCISAASFRARKNNLWQIVLTKPEYSGVYKSVR